MLMFPKLLKSSSLIKASILLTFSTVAPSVNAANLNSLSAYVYDGSSPSWDPDVTQSSATGPVSYGVSGTGSWPTLLTGFPNQGNVAGSADFGVLKARAYSSSHDANSQAFTNVDTQYSVTVNAAAPAPGGGAGLVFGDSVSLNLSFRLDGILNSGAAAGDTTGSVGVSADLRIVDPSIELDCGSPDGCYTPRLLDFGANADSTTYGSTGDTYNSWNWNLSTRNGLDQIIDSQSDSDSWIIGPGATCLGPICNDISFNTGILSTTLETTVGANLDIMGSLSIFAQGTSLWGDGAFGSADFLDTFGLVIAPLTDGVELDYGSITPAPFDLGGATVPVPSAVWLFGTGLVGLIGIARRKKS